MTIQPLRSGKVRDIYDAGENLIIVASDRISAFDAVSPTRIPDKGKILNTLSVFWFARTSHIVDNHLLLHRVNDFPEPWRSHGLDSDWDGRAALVRKAEVVPVECVVRGYLSGSGWKSYKSSGSVCGVALPSGLLESERLPEPIFTPTTKPLFGHDEPITFEEAANSVGAKLAAQLREVSLALYNFAAQTALERGLILADTKFEFGLIGDELILVDEMGTPDSSRYWDAKRYEVARSQDSFDKQFVRDYLEASGWDKNPPAPQLPADVVKRTAAKYEEAYNRITGRFWPDRDVRALA